MNTQQSIDALNTQFAAIHTMAINTNINMNAALDLIEAQIWVLKAQLKNEIVEIEISVENDNLKPDVIRVVNNANVYANKQATVHGVGNTQGMKRFGYDNWLSAFELYLTNANHNNYSLISDRIEHLQSLAKSKDTGKQYK